MGTILQSLPQRRDGLMLMESFESANFMMDQGWTLINGTPSTTQSVAKEGLSSLVLDATNPLILKDFGSTPFLYCAVWFYDDATQTATDYQPGLRIIDPVNHHNFFTGVWNSNSTTNYTPGNIPRTTGWHKFSFVYDSSGGNVFHYIDNVLAFTDTSYPGLAFTQFEIGDINTASTGTAFGYMDWVQICADQFLTLYGLAPGQWLNLVAQEENGGVITAQVQGDGAGQAQLDISGLDFPAQGYLWVGQPPNGSMLFFQSDMLNLSAGDIYLLAVYRFKTLDGTPRRATMFTPLAVSTRNDVMAVAGARQSVFFYDVDKMTLSFRALTDGQKNELLRWWTTVKRGATFGIAIEENDIYLDYTQQAVTAFPNGQLVLASPAIANALGKVLTVQSVDGEIKENVKVKSLAFDPLSDYYTATLDLPQAEAVAAGLQVKALYYWPFAWSTDKALSVVPEDARSKKWNVSFAFQEQIQAPSWLQFLGVAP